MVAYKGGHVEKDLLNKLNMPCLDLETWGCPKYEQLKETIVEPLSSCGFHLNDNILHCPMTECHEFWLWFQTYVVIPPIRTLTRVTRVLVTPPSYICMMTSLGLSPPSWLEPLG